MRDRRLAVTVAERPAHAAVISRNVTKQRAVPHPWQLDSNSRWPRNCARVPGMHAEAGLPQGRRETRRERPGTSDHK